MEYYFNELDPTKFQRLINSILVSKYGDSIRLTPLRGKDGGKDGETASGNPFWEYHNELPQESRDAVPTGKGRYIFQVKHHRTSDTRSGDARNLVISDFANELKKNVINRKGNERVNYFFLLTNVASSKEAIENVDKKRSEILKGNTSLHADIWWQERIIAFLDQMPFLWNSFPELFAGRKVPLLADIVSQENGMLPRAMRLALERQYKRDSLIKFKQIELEKSLGRLFVDLDVETKHLVREENRKLFLSGSIYPANQNKYSDFTDEYIFAGHSGSSITSALRVLMSEKTKAAKKLILEGGPGQGKSTITQMLAQIYRNEILKKNDISPEDRWLPVKKARIPIRIELRAFAEWLNENINKSVEEYLSNIIQNDSGGNNISVDNIHTIVEQSPVLLIFDGLDEVGNDELRDSVLMKISECTERFEEDLKCDLKVIVTTRPPAIAGRREQLSEFNRLPIAPMNSERIQKYLDRWVSVQVQDEDDRESVKKSFNRRREETHVKALAQNPMQLSVLLHFIRLKGEAFPDRRAELYRDYFRTVIDRDVEKSPELRKQRDIIETLHQLLGYKIHSLSEAEQADGMLKRGQLLDIVQEWLNSQGYKVKTAGELFKLGEERLGLIVALKGEGEEARYGYEIQPIREYFAAAFINEQIEGNAHDVYEAMLHRSYWKEVALFLAGLRRPNEKADLILRAKVADDDKDLGWRQHGRSITFQLLQEGVFGQAGQVYSEAINYLIDLFDPSILQGYDEPKNFLAGLPPLIKQGDASRHIDRIKSIIDRYKHSSDEYTLFRLYKVVCKILDKNQSKVFLLKYDGTNLEIKAKILILWASKWMIDTSLELNQVILENKFTSKLACQTWWKASLETKVATDLQFPIEYHSQLVAQYASNPISIYRGSLNNAPLSKPKSKWAIWHFVHYQQLLPYIVYDVDKTKLVKNNFEKAENISYEGLDKKVKILLKELNKELYKVISSHKKTNSETFILSDYVNSAIKYVDEPGIVGWIACQTLLNLIQLFLLPQRGWDYSLFNLDVFRTSSSAVLNEAAINLINTIPEKLSPYYDDIDPQGSRISWTSRLSPRGYSSNGLSTISPNNIRLKNSNLVSVTSLIIDKIRNGKEFPIEWLEEILWTTDIIRPIVEACRNCIPKALKFFYENPFTPDSITYSTKPLLIQDINRVLSEVRKSEDNKTLAGALIALHSSKFLRVAGVKLTLKMLRASSLHSFIASQIFNNKYDYVNDNEYGDIIQNVAKAVIEDSKSFSLKIYTSAAAYLAETLPYSLPPLLTLEESLCVTIRSSEEPGNSI